MNNLIDNEELIDELANLLNYNAEVHHKAFVLMDKEIGSVAPGAYWPRFYARSIVSRYLQTVF